MWRSIVIDELQVHPIVREFATQAELVAYLSGLNNTSWAMPFYGAIMRFTQPTGDGMRYMIGLDGERIPLFNPEPSLEVSDSFYLGETPPDDRFDPFSPNFVTRAPQSATGASESADEDNYDDMAENQDENPVEPDDDDHYPSV